MAAVSWLEGVALERARSPAEWAKDLADPRRMQFVALTGGGRVAGFVALSAAADEAEIHHLAVAPEYRRRGVGRALLTRAAAEAARRGARRLFLDVRARNRAARAMYRRAGFVEAGRRSGYYRAPPDDAVLCRLDLPPAPEVGAGSAAAAAPPLAQPPEKW